MHKGQLAGRHPRQGFEQWPREQLEGDHRGNRVSWQSKEIAFLYSAENNRPTRLNLRACEEELSTKLRKHLLDQVVADQGARLFPRFRRLWKEWRLLEVERQKPSATRPMRLMRSPHSPCAFQGAGGFAPCVPPIRRQRCCRHWQQRA